MAILRNVLIDKSPDLEGSPVIDSILEKTANETLLPALDMYSIILPYYGSEGSKYLHPEILPNPAAASVCTYIFLEEMSSCGVGKPTQKKHACLL